MFSLSYMRSGSRGQSHIRGLSARLMTSREVSGWKSGTSSSWLPSRKRLLKLGPTPAREFSDICIVRDRIKNDLKMKFYVKYFLSVAYSLSPVPCYSDTVLSEIFPKV